MLPQREVTSTGEPCAAPAVLRLEHPSAIQGWSTHQPSRAGAPISRPSSTPLPQEHSLQLLTQDPAAGCNGISTRGRLTQTSRFTPCWAEGFFQLKMKLSTECYFRKLLGEQGSQKKVSAARKSAGKGLSFFKCHFVQEEIYSLSLPSFKHLRAKAEDHFIPVSKIL